MIKKLASHLGEYKRSAIVTPLLSALEAIMDILLPTIMAFIIDQGIEKSDMNAHPPNMVCSRSWWPLSRCCWVCWRPLCRRCFHGLCRQSARRHV